MRRGRPVRDRSASLSRDFGSVTIRSVQRRPTPGGRWHWGYELVAHIAKIHQAPVAGPETFRREAALVQQGDAPDERGASDRRSQVISVLCGLRRGPIGSGMGYTLSRGRAVNLLCLSILLVFLGGCDEPSPGIPEGVLAWISTDESFLNIDAARGAQVVKRSARPFHHGTLTV